MTHQLANAVRFLAADMVSKARSGHPGMPLGMADVLTVLWTRFLNFDPTCPNWYNRDRFILSNGHGSAALYALLYLTGFKGMTLDEIKNFRQLNFKTPGHPEAGHTLGVDFSTGPLGQGLAGGVGMAIAEKMAKARLGSEVVSHNVYVSVGDGCLMEGISEEAIELAGHLKLNNLIVLWDDNQITIDGKTSITVSVDMKKRFEAAGWVVLSANGHVEAEIISAFEAARHQDKPVLIDFKTIIGFGSPKAGTSAVHGSPLKPEELAQTRQALNWPADSFEVPADILTAWRTVGARGSQVRQEWEEQVRLSGKEDLLANFLKKEVSLKAQTDIQNYLASVISEQPVLATRKASQNALKVLVPAVKQLVGGSADLTASNLTNTLDSKPITADDFSGNYINYGIREHAMGAIMNGLAMDGGFIPYGGTFFTFMDYMKPAVRLAALMRAQVMYVFTHDSIGVGEDGPTHQPIEQLATLRATPDLFVFRPCDAVETMESYELALRRQGPSALVLSRQAVPTLRMQAGENLTARGAYILADSVKERQVTLIASGTEVSLALEAQKTLIEHGVSAAVVSMPCWELFEQQPLDYQRSVLGTAPRVAIEAAASFGWHKWVGENGVVLGIDHFGASAPAEKLYEAYGLTVQNIVQVVQKLI